MTADAQAPAESQTLPAKRLVLRTGTGYYLTVENGGGSSGIFAFRANNGFYVSD